MDTDVQYRRIIAHVSGLTDETKAEFLAHLKKSRLSTVVKVVDLDTITTAIIQDKNMVYLMNKLDAANAEQKKSNPKAKDLEKRVHAFWKSKLEYHVLRIMRAEKKALVLIGYNTFFKNHRVALPFSIPFTYFAKADYEKHARSLIKTHLEEYKQDIIDGLFDLSFLDASFLVKRRMNIESIYTKMGYHLLSVPDIVASIEESQTRDTPARLFFASTQVVKKVPVGVRLHELDWVALAHGIEHGQGVGLAQAPEGAAAPLPITVSVKTKTVKATAKQAKQLNKQLYIYEVMPDDELVPYKSATGAPTSYISGKPLKVHKSGVVTNPFKHLTEQLRVKVIEQA